MSRDFDHFYSHFYIKPILLIDEFNTTYHYYDFAFIQS